MKKSFKRAGIAVLSMSMLLSMGAMTAITSNAANYTVQINDPQSTGVSYKYVKIADATEDNGRYKYSGVDAKFSTLIKVNAAQNLELAKDLDSSYKQGTSLGSIMTHSESAQALAQALVDLTDDADYDEIPAAGLASGYYLLKDFETASGGLPVLLSITNSNVTVDAKATTIPFTKTIASINGKTDNINNSGHNAVAEKNSVVTYQLATKLPMYDTYNVTAKTRYQAYPDTAAKDNNDAWDGVTVTEDPNYDLVIKDGGNAVVALYASDITDFTITDIPENTLTIDYSTIKVYKGSVAEANIVNKTKAYTLTTDVANKPTIVNRGENYFTASNDDVAGKGFQIVFKDEYVITNRNADIYVTFNATVADVPDLDTDKNANQAAVEYNNDYFTGGSKRKTPTPTTPDTPTPPPGTPGNPGEPDTPDGPDTKKDDEADVYATLMTVNKVDGNDVALPGAAFKLTNKDTNAVIGEYTASTDTSFVFKGLGIGTYVLEETTTPPGYAKANNIEFTVDATDADKSSNRYLGHFVYSNTADANNTTNIVDVVNYQGETLPGTGGMGTVLFTVGGAAVVLLAGALFVVYMKKRKIKE